MQHTLFSFHQVINLQVGRHNFRTTMNKIMTKVNSILFPLYLLIHIRMAYVELNGIQVRRFHFGASKNCLQQSVDKVIINVIK